MEQQAFRRELLLASGLLRSEEEAPPRAVGAPGSRPDRTAMPAVPPRAPPPMPARASLPARARP